MLESKKKETLIVILAVLFFTVGAAGGAWWWYQSGKIVSTDDARISGTIISVSSKVAGRIQEVNVKEGDAVKTGQVLAKIDSRDAAVQKKQAAASLAAAKAKYDQLVLGARPQEIGQARAEANQAQAAASKIKANLKDAQKTYDRMTELYREGAISAAQRDNAEAAYFMAKEEWRAAQEAASAGEQKLSLVTAGSREEEIRAAAAQVEEATAMLEAAELASEYTLILAPNNGIVTLKNVNSGEVVSAGQTLFSIVDSQDVWLNARIEETKIGRLRLGQKVDYTIDGYAGQIFHGEIFEIGMATNSTFALVPTENASGNFTKVTQRIPVKISLPVDGGNVFRPGMQAVIDIHLE